MIRTSQKIKMIKIDDIMPNPYQTRRKFERKELVSLCESIKEVGILSPIIVRGTKNGYELICGQRRLRAAIMAGRSEIPAMIIRAGDAQCAQISLIENLQRKNLGMTEEAEGYYNLMSYHKVKKENLLKTLSVDSLEVNEKVRFLSLSETVRYKVEENQLSESTIKELLKLHNEEKQLEVIETAVKENLSHEMIAAIVKEINKEMILRKSGGDENRKGKIKSSKEKMPLYINTVLKTVELLKRSGARAQFSKNEQENYLELTIKIQK